MQKTLKDAIRQEVMATLEVLQKSREVLAKQLPKVAADLDNIPNPALRLECLESLANITSALYKQVVDASKLTADSEPSATMEDLTKWTP